MIDEFDFEVLRHKFLGVLIRLIMRVTPDMGRNLLSLFSGVPRSLTLQHLSPSAAHFSSAGIPALIPSHRHIAPTNNRHIPMTRKAT
jgi:hypothetical protein